MLLRKIIFLMILMMLGLLLQPAFAKEKSKDQSPIGTIKGTVIDIETKSPIIGAAIQIMDTQKGSLTDASGIFFIKNVPVDNYALRFSCIGYITVSRTDVIVRPGRISNISTGLKPTTIKVDDVMVTAGYFHEIQDQPTSATNFSGEEIRRAPGSAGDVSRIVMVLPSIAKVNDMINGLAVRGGSSTENAFYIDNIEIPNINHFPIQGTSGGPIGLLNVDFIDNVNFSGGGFSAAYGDKLSSVMEISFREGNREEYDLQLDLNFAGFGVVAEGPIIKNKSSFMFSARRSYLDLLVDAIGTGVAPRYSDYQGRIVYDLSPVNKLSFLGIYGTDFIEFKKDKSIKEGRSNYGPFKGQEFVFGVNWQYLWHKNGYANTSVSILGTKYDANMFETKSDIKLMTNNSLEEIIQLRNVIHYRFDESINIEFGQDLKYFYNDYYEETAAYANAIGDSVQSLVIDQILKAPKYGFYTNFIWKPFNPLTTTLGIRYDYYWINEHQYVSPRFSFAYRLSERTTIKGATGIYYQNLPLGLVSQKKEFEELKDPVAYHYIAGLDYLLTDETKLTIETYYEKYDNFPMDPSQPQLFLVDELSNWRTLGVFEELNSNGKAESYGAELTIQKKLAQNIYGLISGSYFKTKYKGLDGAWRNRLFDNQYIFSVEGGYKPNNKWEFSLRWILAGGPPYSPIDTVKSLINQSTVYDQNRINEARYPAYHSLNVRVDKRFYFKSSSMILYLSIWNAYNRDNVSMYFWNEIDEKQDTRYQWGLLPIIGMEYEF